MSEKSCNVLGHSFSLQVTLVAGALLLAFVVIRPAQAEITEYNLWMARETAKADCRRARALRDKLKYVRQQEMDARASYERVKEMLLKERERLRKAIENYKRLRPEFESAARICKQGKQTYKIMKQMFREQSAGGDRRRSGGGGRNTDMPRPDDCRLMGICPPAGRADTRRRTSPSSRGGGGRRRDMPPPNDGCLMGVCGPGLRRSR